MRGKIMLLATVLCLTCCQRVAESELEADLPPKTKKFTFTVKGDWANPVFTRTSGYLQADGSEMTDLWVFDYVEGECVQSMHQTPGDEDWGRPSMPLVYGSHHVYFVASRGDDATCDESAHTISWSVPKDAFWLDYPVNVVSTSNGNRAVTLGRVATKLRISVNDEVPAGLAEIGIVPSQWYYGIDYISGMPVDGKTGFERTVSVPSAYTGTTGSLVLNIYGLSGTEEWTADISVLARDAGGGRLGSASITGARFMANRATEYSGNLFSSSGSIGVGLNEEWQPSVVGTW